jgi:zinc transporter ZupT
MPLIILTKSFIALFSALAGAGLTFLIKLDHKKLCALISISAGALLGASLFTLIPEALDSINAFELILSGISGYLIFWIISRYYSHICPACSAGHFDEKSTKKFSEIFLTLFTALAFHSFLDGVAISAGDFHAEKESNSIFLAITTHKFPEGLALASLMLGGGYHRTKIFIYTALVELTTVVGAISGIFFIQDNIPEIWMGVLMAHIAGGFIFLSTHAVLGEMLKNHKSLVIVSLTSGLIFILLLRILLG